MIVLAWPYQPLRRVKPHLDVTLMLISDILFLLTLSLLNLSMVKIGPVSYLRKNEY